MNLSRRQPKRRGTILPGLVVLLMVLGACHTRKTAEPITIEELRGLTVTGLETAGGAVALVGGRWEGNPRDTMGSAGSSVQLIEDVVRRADVTGDGAEDAVTFVAESMGGTGSIVYLILAERDGKTIRNSATISLGDGVQIRSVEIDSGVVSAELVQHSDTDPMCCPGDLVRRSWRWKNGMFEEGEQVVEGRLGPESIAGQTWRLVAWNSEELVPDSISITLTYKEGTLAGSAGCNRYFNAVTSGGIPGDIRIGIGGSTRMMCPPELMRYEDRYLAILPAVTQCGFWNGRLFLGYEDNGSARILLFERSTVRSES